VNGIAYKKNGSIEFTKPRSPPQNLDKLPFPAYHLVDMNKYIKRSFAIRGLWLKCGWVVTSRGCPGRCIFCATTLMHGRKVRFRDPTKVIDEIEYLKNRYDIEGFYVLDDTFTLNKQRVLKFCDELKKRELNLKWACQARANTFDLEIGKAIKNAGCVQVEFGVESGSDKVLSTLKKNITVEQTKRVFEICKMLGLRTMANVMIGNPNEFLEDIEKTKKLVKQLNADHTSFFFTTPYPGTELYNMAVKNGWIKLNETNDLIWRHSLEPIMCINFTKPELIKIQEELYNITLKSTFIEYCKQPYFLLDALRTGLKNPRFALKMLALLAGGQKNKAIQLFKREFTGG